MEPEMRIVFIDDNFKYSYGVDFSLDALKAKANAKGDFLKRYWEETKLRAYSSIAQKYPKNWKKFSDFQKVHKKWFFEKVAINDKLAKEGKPNMPFSEWKKGMPKFISKITPKNIRIIFVTKDCATWTLTFEKATHKKFEKIINKYKNEDTLPR